MTEESKGACIRKETQRTRGRLRMRISPRTTLATLCLLTLLSLTPPTTVRSQPAGPPNGNEYLQFTSSLRLAYTVGISEGLTIASKVGAAGVQELMACSKGMTFGQMRAIVDKYLAENPERWHHWMSTIIVDALQSGCRR